MLAAFDRLVGGALDVRQHTVEDWMTVGAETIAHAIETVGAILGEAAGHGFLIRPEDVDDEP